MSEGNSLAVVEANGFHNERIALAMALSQSELEKTRAQNQPRNARARYRSRDPADAAPYGTI